MVTVMFRYKDQYTGGRWAYQQCIVSSVDEAKKIYGLGTDPNLEDWEILSVKEVEEENCDEER